MKRSPLNRKTPLKRTPFKVKRRSDNEWQKARRVALQRSMGRCEAQWGGCYGTSDHVHHKRRRSQGGTNDLDNLLVCCAHCHDQIHRNPEIAYQRKHLLRKDLTSEP